MNKKTKHTGFRPSSWIVYLGLTVFSLGMVSGFLRSADLVAENFDYPVVAHLEGRVAGAVTMVEAGPVSLHIEDGVNPRTYVYDLDAPISVYSLFRLANKKSTLEADFSVSAAQVSTLATIDGVTPARGGGWLVRVDGEEVASIDDVVVLPRSSVVISLSR